MNSASTVMNLRPYSFRSPTVRSAALVLGLALSLVAAPAARSLPTNAPAAPPTAAPATPAAAEVASSVFAIPATEKEGRDPFFPSSTRLRPAPPPPGVTSRARPVIDLQLKGISGPPNNRLAIINNQSLKEGEEADVTTTTGRAHVRCLEIKAESVIVETGGQRRELRLRAGL